MMITAEPADISPARKAWITRRARDAHRETIETAKHGTGGKVSPLDGEKIVALQLDEDSEVGSGRRLYVVIDIDDRHATLFYVPRLLNKRIDRATFDRFAKPSAKSSPRKTIALIRDQVTLWRKCFPDDCELAIKRAERAIAALKGKRP